jgi:hypothetical protein
VIAWRAWDAVTEDGETRLSSIYRPTAWPKREALEAVCGRLHLRFIKTHAAPLRRCRCGIHGTSPDVLCDFLDGDLATAPSVIGRVSLWGSVIECERGWRASHAYPERLFVTTRGGSLEGAAHIAAGLEGYGVPVDVVAAPTARRAIEDIASITRHAGPGSGVNGVVATVHPQPEFWRW